MRPSVWRPRCKQASSSCWLAPNAASASASFFAQRSRQNRSTCPCGLVMCLKATRARLVLDITAPICVDTRAAYPRNVFVSGDTLSGGTQEGALAAQLRARYGKPVEGRWGRTTRWPAIFNAIRITHAFPAQGNARPAALPSIPRRSEERNCSSPQLIDGQAPGFHHDWKPRCAQRSPARARTGPHPGHLGSLRTVWYVARPRCSALPSTRGLPARLGRSPSPTNAGSPTAPHWLADAYTSPTTWTLPNAPPSGKASPCSSAKGWAPRQD